MKDHIERCADHFNSHARVGHDYLLRLFVFLCFYFNSHARVGRDALSWVSLSQSKISTHTPV